MAHTDGVSKSTTRMKEPDTHKKTLDDMEKRFARLDKERLFKLYDTEPDRISSFEEFRKPLILMSVMVHMGSLAPEHPTRLMITKCLMIVHQLLVSGDHLCPDGVRLCKVFHSTEFDGNQMSNVLALVPYDELFTMNDLWFIDKGRLPEHWNSIRNDLRSQIADMERAMFRNLPIAGTKVKRFPPSHGEGYPVSWLPFLPHLNFFVNHVAFYSKPNECFILKVIPRELEWLVKPLPNVLSYHTTAPHLTTKEQAAPLHDGLYKHRHESYSKKASVRFSHLDIPRPCALMIDDEGFSDLKDLYEDPSESPLLSERVFMECLYSAKAPVVQLRVDNGRGDIFTLHPNDCDYLDIRLLPMYDSNSQYGMEFRFQWPWLRAMARRECRPESESLLAVEVVATLKKGKGLKRTPCNSSRDFRNTCRLMPSMLKAIVRASSIHAVVAVSGEYGIAFFESFRRAVCGLQLKDSPVTKSLGDDGQTVTDLTHGAVHDVTQKGSNSVESRAGQSVREALPSLNLRAVGVTDLTTAQCEVASKWSAGKSVVIYSETYAAGRTTVALLLILAEVISIMDWERVRGGLHYMRPPIAICLFNTQEAAEHACIMLTRVIKDTRAAAIEALGVDELSEAYWMQFPSVKLFRGRVQSDSDRTDILWSKDAAVDILCTTLDIMSTAYTANPQFVHEYRLKLVMVEDAIAEPKQAPWKTQNSNIPGIMALIRAAEVYHRTRLRMLVVAPTNLKPTWEPGNLKYLDNIDLLRYFQGGRVHMQNDDEIVVRNDFFVRYVREEETSDSEPEMSEAELLKKDSQSQLVRRTWEIFAFLREWGAHRPNRQLIIFATHSRDVERVHEVLAKFWVLTGDHLPDLSNRLAVLHSGSKDADTDLPPRHDRIDQFLDSSDNTHVLISTSIGTTFNYTLKPDVLILDPRSEFDVSTFDNWYIQQACTGTTRSGDDPGHVTTFLDKDSKADIALLKNIKRYIERNPMEKKLASGDDRTGGHTKSDDGDFPQTQDQGMEGQSDWGRGGSMGRNEQIFIGSTCVSGDTDGQRSGVPNQRTRRP